MKGRKRKPTELKLMAGNPGGHASTRLNPNEPKPETGAPEPLVWLTPEGLDHYRALTDKLLKVRVLTVNDGPALSGLAQSIADYEQATRELALSGKVIKGDKGQSIRSPWTVIQKQAFDQMQRGFTDFGLTPAARARIVAAPKGDDKDESEALFG